MTKPFCELTAEEAKDRAKDCTRGAQSVAEVRRRLTESGFNGAAVTMTSHTSHGMTMYMFMVMVYGPNGQTISC